MFTTSKPVEPMRIGNSEEKKAPTFLSGARVVLLTGRLNLLLVFAPIGIAGYYLHWNDGVVFIISLLAIAPLAERLGFCTEQLAMHTNDTIGGLLNATFGNATELIVAIAALQKNLFRLVQLSLLGSILSNLLLVLGAAFFFGGLKFKEQKFNKVSSQVNATLLMLSTFGVLFPTVLTYSNEETHNAEMFYSRASSIVLFCTYIAFLYFQIITHPNFFASDPVDRVNETISLVPQQQDHHTPSAAPNSHRSNTAGAAVNSRQEEAQHSSNGGKPIDLKKKLELETDMSMNVGKGAEEEEEEDEDLLGFKGALFWLGLITLVIAVLSEALADTITVAAASANISSVFLSVIVLPIVGNAAEHASSVMFAMKDNLDLSLGVAVGSSTQIAIGVMPVLVLIGWMMNKDLSMNFGAYESVTLILTVITVTFAMKDGTSNWVMGAVLMMAYVLIAIGFLAKTDENLES